MKPKISFLMTTFNDATMLVQAIESVRHLEFNDWELLVLDNSNTSGEPWKILEAYSDRDYRIRVWKYKDENGKDGNCGWCKGTSILLSYATGEYITFLSADDFLDGQGMKKVVESINNNEPDVIFVGMACVVKTDNGLQVRECSVPEHRYYYKDDRRETIFEVMASTYYNSMFHYCKRDFLARNGIDFFDPFFGDCASMTAALCRAEKIEMVDDIVYYLTMNTSQTKGHYIVNGCLPFAKQWEEVCLMFEKYENDKQSDEYLTYIATRIWKNYEGNLKLLKEGDKFRDVHMNKIELGEVEKMREIECCENNAILKDLQKHSVL